MDDEISGNLETTLTAWGQAAVRAEERSPRRYRYPTTLSPRRRRTVHVSVAAIAALASAVTIWSTREVDSPPPAAQPATTTCPGQFGTGRVAESLQSLPPTITVTVTYTGHAACTIDAHAPRLELRDSKQRVLLKQDRSATFDLQQITVAPGDDVTFQIQGFLKCFSGARAAYTLNVYLASSPVPDRVVVPVEREVTTIPFRGCGQAAIGKVSNLRRGA